MDDLKSSIFKGTTKLEHFLIREIKEQPLLIENVITQRYGEDGALHFDELSILEKDIIELEKICFVAHGSSYHAALICKYLMETICNLHVDVVYPSDFITFYKDKALLIAISQSGETTDTVNALASALNQGIKSIAITNKLNSTIAKLVKNNVINIMAGKENAISATKSYVLTLFNLILFTLYIARIKRYLNSSQFNSYINEIDKLPALCEEVIENREIIYNLTHNLLNYQHFLFLGRGRVDYPTALEGALKLKETAYLHGEGINDSTLKHGPIAMIDERFVTISIATNLNTYNKVMSNIKRMYDNKAYTIAMVTQDDYLLSTITKYIIKVPNVPEYLSPIINVIPFQLLAYYLGYQKGLPVDRPRNLVKSVLEQEI